MRFAIVSLLLLGAAVLVYGQTAPSAAKPNYSGTWVFDSHKSKLVVPAPSSMTLEIKQEDPKISFVRAQTYGDQNFNWKLAANVDDPKPVQEDGPGYVTDSRVYWQQNSLVLDQKMTASDGTKVSDVVTYTLLPDGSLQAFESQTTVGGKGVNNNKWIYDKKAQ
ncbi:MAG TPA: hypothetical protein VGG15_07950 [Terriglobales bacterium]|jgi:hypothetical protein